MVKSGFIKTISVITIVFLLGLVQENIKTKIFNEEELYPKTSLENTGRDYFKKHENTNIGNVELRVLEKISSRTKSRECLAQKNFVYIKTHKTGSTTVWNVMTAFTEKNKFPVAHKMFKPFMGGYPGKIKPSFTYKMVKNDLVQVNTHQDVSVSFLDHFRYNSDMKKYMPSDTKYISVVREPWSHFQSSFHYYYHDNIYSQERRINCAGYPYFHLAQGKPIDLLDYLKLAATNLNHSVPWYFRSKNGQSYDLGIDPMLDNDVIIKKEVEKISSELDLVLITEYMDESMILLKEMFCMDWEDIIFQDDGKSHKYKSASLPTTFEDQQIFNEHSKLDIALYKKFNETLWTKIETYGTTKMENDVAKLRELRKEKYKKTNFRIKSLNKRNIPKRNIQIKKQALYDLSLKNFNKKTMKTMLKYRISTEAKMKILQASVDQIAEYMLDNSGGCPL